MAYFGGDGIRGSVSVCDAEQHLPCQEDVRLCKVDGWMVSDRGFGWLLPRASVVYRIQRECNDELSVWLFGGRVYRAVAQTFAFVLFDSHISYRIWRLSRQMIAFLWKLPVKPVLESNQDAEKLKCILNFIFKTSVWRVPK